MSARKKNLVGKGLRQALDDACRGLVYVSETDSPIVPVLSATPNDVTVEEFIKNAVRSNGPVEKRPTAAFFDRLTSEKAWQNEEERSNAGRFSKLRAIVLDQLDGPATYRIGRVQIDIFVLGRDEEGRIAGFRTRSVET
ncbi:MAG: hypothetical protein IT174_10400 [Acidobacteria bacterium]|nr:hypothetical protein [Acidobacteriota bacterium]